MTYQTAPGMAGTFPTADWFAALLRGIHGPLGSVLDVGCAEGVMSALAVEHGATSVLGVDSNAERIAIARSCGVAAFSCEDVRLTEYVKRDTVILSMIAHWIGPDVTRYLAGRATRNLAIIFREANDHYAIPENGTWFPTLDELDVVVGGIRTHEELLLTQDNGKRIVAATYRTDMRLEGTWVRKVRPDFQRTGLVALTRAGAPLVAYPTNEGYAVSLAEGLDMYGDPPFRPNGSTTITRDRKVRGLARGIARAALHCGWYPTDFSPRNIIVGPDVAALVDLDEIEPYEGRVSDRYLSIWQASLGDDFTGDLRELV